MYRMNNATTLALTIAFALVGSLAVPMSASADDQEPCDGALTRLSDAGEDLGYSISSTASGLTGTLGRTQLNASCSAGHVEIELLEGRGSTVSVNFSAGSGNAFALELHGEYPGLGSISRIAMIDDVTAEPMTGFLNFTAEMGAESAFAEFELGGDLVANGGDVALVNERFAPVLNASVIWKDAHVLTFALADIWESDVAPHEAGLDKMLELAVPSPDPLYSKSVKAQLLACGAAALTCGASWWVPPAVGACVGQASACAISIACTFTECLD